MEAWAREVGIAFRCFLGDIGNEAPLYLRGVPNRTSVVECEGPESQADTGTERESRAWLCRASQFDPHLRHLRSHPVGTSTCSSVPPYSFLSRQVLGPRHQHTKGHQPTWVRARFCMYPPSPGNKMFGGIPLQPEHISKPHERGIF